MSASDAAPLPRLGEVFFDVRGDSRSMRLSWYADTGIAVFSIWSGGRCTGTFRLPIDDLPRMIEILQRGPERNRRSLPDGGRPERADRGRPRNEPGYYGEGDYSDGDDADGIFGDGGHDGGHGDAGYEPGAYGQGAHDPGGYDRGGYDHGGYDQGAHDSAHGRGGYDQGGYPDAGYGPAADDQGGSSRDGYATDGYGADRHRPDVYGTDRYADNPYGPDQYGTDAHSPEGYGADQYGTDAHSPEGYGADDPLSSSRSRRPDGGLRAAGAADSAGYPDMPGYSGARLADASRQDASRSGVPAGSNWRPPDDYQPAEYQTGDYPPAHYQTDGYQPSEYPADGYQTAAYQPGPADHEAGAQSDPAGYGQERFVPPYVQARSDAYPNDNPVPGRARRLGGTGPAYPADHGGVSAEPHPYARSPRSGPGYFEGSEDRLAADTPVSARYSAGGRGS